MQTASATRTPKPIDPKSRALWLTVAFLPFLLVAVAYAYYGIFSHFAGDDEGYLMISVRGFLQGHPLYDSVFTQYGPLYYFYEWFWHSLIGLPLTHDATRLFCIAHWLAAALTLAVAAGLSMRSVAAGLFVFVQAVPHLLLISNEPGHPQELIAFLLALSVLLSVLLRSKPWPPLEALAVLCAATVLIKVNVGGFLCFALLWSIRCHAADRLNRAAWMIPGALIFACLPILLMRAHLGAEWCRNYALVAAATVLTCTIMAWRFSQRIPIKLDRSVRTAASFTGVIVLTLAILALIGTSIWGCIDGLLLTPLKLPGVALNPILIPNSALWNASLSVLTAGWVLMTPRGQLACNALAILKLLFGGAGCFWLVESNFGQLAFLLPWSWLILVPVQASPDESAAQTFPRVFLVLAAAWQGLQAYPMAGTQVALATFLLVPIYTLALRDALVPVNRTKVVQRTLQQITPSSAALLRLLGTAALLYLFAMVWCQPHLARRTYETLQPLGLPGTDRIRLSAEAVAQFQGLTAYLDAECDTFVSYPGFNSLYFWTRKRPPTQLNGTGWGQLTPAQQQHILNALTQAKRPLLVVHEFVTRGWNSAVPIPIQTLVNFVQHQCVEVNRIGPYIFYRPKATLDNLTQDLAPGQN